MSPDLVLGIKTVTIDEALVGEGEAWPANAFADGSRFEGTVFLRMGRQPNFGLVKDFMSVADRTIELRFDGGPPVLGEVGVGGITVEGVSFAVWRPSGGAAVPAAVQAIEVRALNEEGERDWTVAPSVAMR